MLNNSKATSNIELNDIGQKLLGSLFLGCFSSDEIPRLNNTECCIINTDGKNKNGTHWCALIRHNNTTYFYDSFHRNYKKLSPHWKNKKWVMPFKKDNMKEQSNKSELCGQISLSFILTFIKFGPIIYEYI